MCPVGFYSLDGAFQLPPSQCTPCPSGYESTHEGTPGYDLGNGLTTFCTKCAPGYVSTAVPGNPTICTPCPVGYVPSSDATYCMSSCPAGTAPSADGLSCLSLCPAGKVCIFSLYFNVYYISTKDILYIFII